MHLLTQIGLVSLGSAAGGLTRWGVQQGCGKLFGTSFPWGTLLINLSGSFFVGWFLAVLAEQMAHNREGWLRADDLRLLVAVGFTGAYTTFSAFEFETHELLHEGRNLAGTLYMGLSIFLGLIAVRLGIMLGGPR